MNDERLERINPATVRVEFSKAQGIIAGHLDLEGFAYIKIVRDGPQSCFFQDVTQRVLEGMEPDTHPGGGMTKAEIEKVFWREPAAVKWGRA